MGAGRDRRPVGSWDVAVIKRYIYNILLSLDQHLNVFLLGDPDESISGRAGRALLSGRPKIWVVWIARVIDQHAYALVGEVDHCINAVEHEENPGHKELWSWIKPLEGE